MHDQAASVAADISEGAARKADTDALEDWVTSIRTSAARKSPEVALA